MLSKSKSFEASSNPSIDEGLVATFDQVTDELESDMSCSGVCNIDKITCGPQG